MRNDRTQSLKNEIARLKRENSFLRDSLGTARALESSKDDGGYFSYLLKTLKGNSLYRAFERFTNYFAKFRLVSMLLRILTFALLAVQTSAIIFILTSVLAIALPPVIITFLFSFLLAVSRFHSDKNKTLAAVSGKKIIVLFPSRKDVFGEDGFLFKNASELSQRGYSVFAVSPFMLSGIGISGDHRFYINCRQEKNGVTLIRRQYFFHIKKKILDTHGERIIFIY